MVSLAFLAGSLWFAFSVELGGRTFAQHIDRISETPEAKDLIDGTRSTVNPVLQEATDRMLGEHIEAPIAAEPTPAAVAEDRNRTASTPERTRLPGQL